jgi:hypothetical protein
MPPSQAECKQFIMPDYKTLKADPTSKAKIQQDKLVIKGRVQTQFMKPVLPEVPKTAGNDISNVSSSEDKAEGGSIFKGFSANVSNVHDIARIRKILALIPEVAAATHVVLAYRLKGHGKIEENFDSDRDWNCGLELLKSMKSSNLTNTLWIATRTCSSDFKHIGNRRFELMTSLCAEAHGLNEG